MEAPSRCEAKYPKAGPLDIWLAEPPSVSPFTEPSVI